MLPRLCCLFAVAVFEIVAQDWPALFNDLVSADAVVREAAGRRVFSLLHELAAKDASDLNAAVLPLLPLGADSRDAVRSQVSGLFVGLALNRSDGLSSLRSAIPLFIKQLKDPNRNVRLNAHLILSNLRPLPPPEAIEAFGESLGSMEIRAAGSAAVGLGRLSATSPRAMELLNEAIENEPLPERLVALLYGFGEAKTRAPKVVQSVIARLDHRDSRVIFAALDCLGKLGPAAAEAEPALRRMVAGGGTPGTLKREIADAAKTTLDRLGKQ